MKETMWGNFDRQLDHPFCIYVYGNHLYYNFNIIAYTVNFDNKITTWSEENCS